MRLSRNSLKVAQSKVLIVLLRQIDISYCIEVLFYLQDTSARARCMARVLLQIVKIALRLAYA